MVTNVCYLQIHFFSCGAHALAARSWQAGHRLLLAVRQLLLLVLFGDMLGEERQRLHRVQLRVDLAVLVAYLRQYVLGLARHVVDHLGGEVDAFAADKLSLFSLQFHIKNVCVCVCFLVKHKRLVYFFRTQFVSTRHKVSTNEWKRNRIAQLRRILEADVEVFEEQIRIETNRQTN